MIIPVALPYTPQTSNSFVNYLAIPPAVDCPTYPLTPFVGSLGESWNCIACNTAQRYFIPFLRGDILYFQTALPDRKNPTISTLIAGWGQSTSPNLNFTYVRAEMYDCDGATLIFGDIDLFAFDFWVSFNTQIGSIQNFTINTGTLPIGTVGFRIKIITYKPDNSVDRIVWTEPYKIPTCQTPSILIESEYKNLDCIPRFYGIPNPFLAASSNPPVGYTPVPYRASFRILGEIALNSFSVENLINENDKILSQVERQTYEIQAYEEIPPYAAELLKTALYGNNLTIEGAQYVNAGEIQKNTENSPMFLPTVTVEKVCRNANKSCN
jgi:hypothetical protein